MNPDHDCSDCVDAWGVPHKHQLISRPRKPCLWGVSQVIPVTDISDAGRFGKSEGLLTDPLLPLPGSSRREHHMKHHNPIQFFEPFFLVVTLPDITVPFTSLSLLSPCLTQCCPQYFLIQVLMEYIRVDDPVSACPLHSLSGLWGLFFTGLMAKESFLVQVRVSECSPYSILAVLTQTALWVYTFRHPIKYRKSTGTPTTPAHMLLRP